MSAKPLQARNPLGIARRQLEAAIDAAPEEKNYHVRQALQAITIAEADRV